jgi:hypothetical protein
MRCGSGVMAEDATPTMTDAEGLTSRDDLEMLGQPHLVGEPGRQPPRVSLERSRGKRRGRP